MPKTSESAGVPCQRCGGRTRVDKTISAGGNTIRRRYCQSADCGHEFFTIETPDAAVLRALIVVHEPNNLPMA